MIATEFAASFAFLYFKGKREQKEHDVQCLFDFGHVLSCSQKRVGPQNAVRPKFMDFSELVGMKGIALVIDSLAFSNWQLLTSTEETRAFILK